MTFYEYLEVLLGREFAKRLVTALKRKKVIIVSGPRFSGKTTLVKVLLEYGYKAVEKRDLDIYEHENISRIYEVTLSTTLKNPLSGFADIYVEKKPRLWFLRRLFTTDYDGYNTGVTFLAAILTSFLSTVIISLLE
jgi:predicted AAA+ superfamily ATPase